jgi:hypothetical protein
MDLPPLFFSLILSYFFEKKERGLLLADKMVNRVYLFLKFNQTLSCKRDKGEK